MNDDHRDLPCWEDEALWSEDERWRRDLIETEQRLKALAERGARVSEHVIKAGDGHDARARLAPDDTLEAVIGAYAVLRWLFELSEYREHYRPSPYASRFLAAFESSGYLRQASLDTAPAMTRDEALGVVADLNQRLQGWYASLREPACRAERRKHARNSRKNEQRFQALVEALQDQYSRLQVVRVDCEYTQESRPDITYELAHSHRERLLRRVRADYPSLVGYAWKLEWGQETGLHYHFIFFFDGHQVRQDIQIGEAIGRHWVLRITEGQGRYFNCNRGAAERYRFNALGALNYHDLVKRQGLAHLGRYLTKVDSVAAMTTAGRTFQTSQIDKAEHRPKGGRPRQIVNPVKRRTPAPGDQRQHHPIL